MKTIPLIVLAATTIAISSALAGDEVTNNKDYKSPVPPETPCFRDQELQLDIFGSYMNLPHADDQLIHHRNPGQDGGGGGVGVNYFFLRFVGLGVDGDINSNRGGVADYTGKLLLRYPIQTGKLCLAPYIFGGGGGESFFRDDFNYDHFRDHKTTGAYMTGGGIEWRATPHWGVFTEGRYTWTGGRNNDGDNAQVRLGLRYAF